MSVSDDAAATEPGSVNPEFHGPVMQAITAGMIERLDIRHNYGRLAMTSALDDESVQRLQEVFVEPPGWNQVLDMLPGRKAVALVGEAESGRRTAAVSLLASLRLRVQELLVSDVGDLDRHFSADPDCGYILAIPSAMDPDLMLILVNNYLDETARANSFMVIIATQSAANALNLAARGLMVRIDAPESTEVFRRVIECSGHADAAAEWAQYPEIVERLRGTRPADAFRLASLVADVLSDQHGGDPLTEVLAAHGNWSEEIHNWDKKVEAPADGSTPDPARDRAMLLAVAAIEGAQPAEVVTAATALMSVAHSPQPKGAALAGPGINARLGRAGATIDGEGRVTFNRTGYGRAVLDHVWKDRPDLQQILTNWLSNVHTKVPADVGERAGDALLELAQRQGDAAPALKLAQTLAQAKQRSAAARVITVAATSHSIGKATRKKLYEWAKLQAPGDNLHLLLADVCSGDMAVSFPQVALVRLRHLADRDEHGVRAALIGAVCRIAAEQRLGFQLEREVVAWTSAREPTRALSGNEAFLALARLQTSDSTPLMLSRLSGSDAVEILGQGWRWVFRDPATRSEGREVVSDWLDAGLREQTCRNLLVQVIPAACKASKDASLVARAILEWSRRSTDPVPPARYQLQLDIMEAIFRKDGLMPIPSSDMSAAESEGFHE